MGDHVVCGLYAPAGEAGDFEQLDPETLRHESILDHPDVERVAAKLQGIQRFSYGDTDRIVSGAYPLTHLIETAWASLGAPGSELCDPGRLLTLPERAEKTKSFVVVTRADQSGILTETFGSIYLIEPTNMDVAKIAVLISILLPSLSRARELAKRAVSGSNLRSIGQAIRIYAYEHNGRFPASLDVLIEESLITPQQLVSPRQDNDEVSYVYIAGQDEDSHPNNVVAYERMLDEEGTNVLFLDGRVEWMRPDLFATYLADTKARVKQAAEQAPEETP